MKKFFKGFATSVLILIIFLTTLLIINSVDDKPHKFRAEYDRYLNNPKLDDNIFIYLLGLTHVDEHETSVEKIYSLGKEKVSKSIKELKNSDILNEFDSTQKEIIELKGDKIENITCVTDYKNTEPCSVTLDQINKKISDNKIFFNNLSKAISYNNYSEFLVPNSFSTFINANQIISAKVGLEAKAGNAELAYKIWLENYYLNKKILLGEHFSVVLALAIVNYSSSIKSLNTMIYYQPKIIDKHYDEIKQIFEPIELKNMPIEKIGMVEYAMIYYTITNNQKLFHKPFYLENNSLNMYFTFYEDFTKLSKSGMLEYPKNLKEFYSKYNKNSILLYLSFRNPIFKLASGLMLNGLSQGVELFTQIKNIETKSRISLAVIDILKQKIPKEKIQNFLDENKTIYYNAMNGDGLKYNIENNSVYTKTTFEDDKNASDVITYEVFF